MPVKNRMAELLPENTAWRRDFHQHPELGFAETRSAGVIADLAYESPAPEDETWADEDAVPEWFYIVRFKQTELWGETYTGPPNDTLQTEIPERWLTPAQS